MKTIVLTFDDGRLDQYTNAVSVMDKYGLKGTIFVTTGFIDGTIDNKQTIFPSSGGEAMTIEQVRKCIENGHEIGAHSDKHTNSVEDIQRSISKLNNWTRDLFEQPHLFGFASPSSEIYEDNYYSLLERLQGIKYYRTSIQVRRNGLAYTILFLANKVLKSNRLFYYLNKKYIKSKYEGIVTSVPVRADTSLNNIKNLIERMGDKDICVLLFHGILKISEKNKMNDCWYYSYEQFEKLCAFLCDSGYRVCTLECALETTV